MHASSTSAQRIPVSTILLTKNSAATLPAYIASMQMIDDIIVLDGGSTDGTADLLKHFPDVRVFPQNPRYLDEQGFITDFSAIRNEGYTYAKHPWILCVDADEAAPEKLLSEVSRVIKEGVPGVYYVKRTFYLNGKPLVTLAKSTSDQIRLFHTACVRGCVKPVHEKLDIIAGSPKGYLDADVSVPLPELQSVRRKYDRFLRLEANANKGISFHRWFRWLCVRNLLAIARRPLVMLANRLMPVPGARLPIAYDWEQIRYSWLLLWRTCPLWSSWYHSR